MPDNSAPYEIIAAPATLYVAPVGEAFPDVDTTPAGNWVKVGTTGDFNYSEDGVTINHGQSVEVFRALGSTGPRKAWRTEEELIIGLTLVDISLEQYKHAMNQNTVTTTPAAPGTPGTKSIGLSRGMTLDQRALLIRGTSPYGDDFAAQYEVPIAVEQGSPEVVFRKGEPAGLQLEFQALEDPNAATADVRFGTLTCQTADAGT